MFSNHAWIAFATSRLSFIDTIKSQLDGKPYLVFDFIMSLVANGEMSYAHLMRFPADEQDYDTNYDRIHFMIRNYLDANLDYTLSISDDVADFDDRAWAWYHMGDGEYIYFGHIK